MKNNGDMHVTVHCMTIMGNDHMNLMINMIFPDGDTSGHVYSVR